MDKNDLFVFNLIFHDLIRLHAFLALLLRSVT